MSVGGRGDSISVVEASYDLQADDQAWLLGVARNLTAVAKPSHGMLAYHCDRGERGLRLTDPVFVDGPKGDGAKIIEQQRRLAATLRDAWGPYRSACPVPAGGMTVERVGERRTFFGPDTVLLSGGSLLAAGAARLERTRTLVTRVEHLAEERAPSPMKLDGR